MSGLCIIECCTFRLVSLYNINISLKLYWFLPLHVLACVLGEALGMFIATQVFLKPEVCSVKTDPNTLYIGF
jgi:hypothetical protein